MLKYKMFGGIIVISIEELKDLANRLKFDMSEEEYQTLQKEFEVILKQMDLIGQIENVDTIEPMTFPYQVTASWIREDEEKEGLELEELMSNIKDRMGNFVKVPKVVG